MTPAVQRCLGVSFAVVSMLSATSALAHGSMEVPLSRVYSCFKEGPETPKSDACKALIQAGGTQALYDWNGVRQGNANDRHRDIIPDGKLCSAANESHRGLDLARTDWPSTRIAPDPQGRFEFVFHATAVHATSYFRLYATREGYNPALPLKWSDLEANPFCTITHASAQNNRYRLNCPFPQGKTGSHVIYGIWQRSDSPEAFYACIDVEFSDTPPPSSWKELGQVQAREDLPAGSAVTLRVFDAQGGDAEAHEHPLATATPAAQWIHALAQRVNAASSRVQVGVLDAEGRVHPVQSTTANRVYARDTGYSFQLDIVKPPPGGGGEPVYPAGIEGYTAGTVVRGTDGLRYRCKPFPYSGWCQGAALHYAPGTGLSWQDAWERIP